MKLTAVKPVPPPPPSSYTLTLSYEEMMTLRAVAGFDASVAQTVKNQRKIMVRSDGSAYVDQIQDTLNRLWQETAEYVDVLALNNAK